MIQIIQQAFFITIAFLAIGLYLWVFLSVSAWLWRKLLRRLTIAFTAQEHLSQIA